MACETAKESWEKLKEEFGGSSQTRNMQVLNLRRQFETLKMQEAEVVKEYVDRLMNVVNKMRLLGKEITDKRIVLVSLPERAWLIDNGCTNHMTHDLENFVKLDQAYQSSVTVENGEFVKVKGRGDVLCRP
ncbi:uncharacterized protein LOC116105098 [Pistacia vera]|uniref:uncharacterized protein LOC116105098 n=1 Tax=Pistacia vera TaxID=55513 RepID=UPI00126392D2|nr:uncharacterized protein LOC116105098 [Pistacia vera]